METERRPAASVALPLIDLATGTTLESVTSGSLSTGAAPETALPGRATTDSDCPKMYYGRRRRRRREPPIALTVGPFAEPDCRIESSRSVKSMM